MPVSLDYGLNINPVEEQEGVPLDYGLASKEKQGVPLSYGLKIDEEREPIKMPEKPFMAKHPNLWALGKTAKDMFIPSALRYRDKGERERVTQEAIQDRGAIIERSLQEQMTTDVPPPFGQGARPQATNEMLQNYGEFAGLKLGPMAAKGFKNWNRALFNKTVGQKIAKYKAKTGEMPPKETIMDWWQKASKKASPKLKAIMEEGRVKLKQVPPVKEVVAEGAGSIPITKATIGEIKQPFPKYAQSINLEKQKISPTAKQIELAVAGDKPIQTWAQTENLAKNIDKAVVLDKLKKGGGLNTAETHVIRQTNIDAVQELGNIIKSSASDAELNAKILNYKDNIFKLASNAASEQGRSLNYYKKELGPTQIGNALGKLQKGLNPRQIKRLKEVVDSDFEPGKVKQFTSELDDPKLKDYVLEFWYNSILSGPPTHVVNVASNTAWSMYQVPHRAFVGLIDKAYSTFTGKARTRFVNETIPMMAGYKTGLKKGAKGAREMMKTGEVADFETKWAQEVGLRNIAAWERSPHKWMRKVAPVVSMPTKALRAMDVWANSIAYDGEVNSIISRMATKKGLKGTAGKAYETELKQNLPASIHDKAMKMAKHSTFMDDPDKFTSWFLKSREIPVIGVGSRFVVPFVNTIGNLTKRGLEFTPGVGIAKEAVSRAMGRGLGTPEIIAKQIEGSLLGLYILSKLDKGEIIGEAPQSKSEREAMYRQGKKPWSIKLGDIWYQYRRAEPYNTAIASVAIAYNAIKNAKDDATATEIFGNMARGLVNNILDSSYFQGLQLVFNKYEKFKTAPPRMGASFVPYSSFWRSMNRAYEKATEGEAKVREKQGWLNAFAQVIPGLSGDIPAELNVWGEEKVIPGSIFQHWLPYKWVRESDDSVEKELKRLEVYPALPSNQYTVSGEKKTFSEDVYRNLCLDFGHRAKTLLGKHISKQSYQEAKETTIIDKRKLKNIDKILTRERNRARKKAIVKQMKIRSKPNVQ